MKEKKYKNFKVLQKKYKHGTEQKSTVVIKFNIK